MGLTSSSFMICLVSNWVLVGPAAECVVLREAGRRAGVLYRLG